MTEVRRPMPEVRGAGFFRNFVGISKYKLEYGSKRYY
jgi:hypothetical protein